MSDTVPTEVVWLTFGLVLVYALGNIARIVADWIAQWRSERRVRRIFGVRP